MLGKSKKTEWHTLKPFTGHNNTTLNLGIYSKEDFEQLLHYERIRSDRSNSHFSLVVFEVEHKRSTRNDAKVFIDMIRKNVRTIDHVGWFKGKVGVLLPETDRSQAMLFVKALNKRSLAEMVLFTIYSYPDRSRKSATEDDADYKNENPSEVIVPDGQSGFAMRFRSHYRFIPEERTKIS